MSVHGDFERKPLEPLQPQAAKGSMGSRALTKGAAAGTKILALPVSLLAYPTRVGAQICHPLLVKILGGAAFATAWTADTILGAAEKVIDSGLATRTIQGLTPTGRKLVDSALDRADFVRDAQGELVQQSATGARRVVKVVSAFLPWGGAVSAVTDTVADTASFAEKHERAMEKAHTGLIRRGLGFALETMRQAAPLIFWAIKAGAISPLKSYVAQPLKNAAYSVWTNPEQIREGLQNDSDMLDSYSSRLWHCFSATHESAPVVQKALPSTADVSKEDIARFKDRTWSPDARADILWVVCNTNRYSISNEMKTKFTQAVKMVNEGKPENKSDLALMLAIYTALPPQEKNSLTPQLFSKFDEQSKLKLFGIVQKFAKLSDADRAFLLKPELRHISRFGDWGRIPDTLRTAVEELIVKKFNTLPDKHRQKMLSLSVEQYEGLTDKDKKHLFTALQAALVDSKYSQDLTELDLTKKEDITYFLKLYDKVFTKEEKFFLFSQLSQDAYFICPTTKDELDQLIKEQETLLQTNIDTEQRTKTQALITWLKGQSAAFSAKEPETTLSLEPQMLVKGASGERIAIDFTKIHTSIGLHVGPLETSGQVVGSLGALLPKALGVASWAFMSGVGYFVKPHGIQIAKDSPLRKLPLFEKFIYGDGYLMGSQGLSTFEDWLQYVLMGTGAAADLLLMCPFFHPAFMNMLTRYNIPAFAIEQTLRVAPATMMQAGISMLPAATTALETVTTPISNLSKYVLDVSKTAKTAATLPGANTEVAQFNERLHAVEQQLAATVEELCTCIPGQKEQFICNREVYEYLQHPELWEDLAAKLGVPPGSKEFIAAFTNSLRQGKMPWGELQKMPASNLDELDKVVHAASAGTGDTAGNWFTNAINALFATRWGQSAQELAKAAKTSGIVSGAQKMAEGVTAKIGDIKDAAADVLARGTRLAKELYGSEQAVPEEVARWLGTIAITQEQLAKVKASQATAQLAMLALQEMNKTITGSIVTNVVQNETLQAAAQFYQDNVETAIKSGTLSLQTLYHLASASQKFLEAQVSAEMPGGSISEALGVDAAMATLQQKSLGLLKSEESSWKGTVVDAAGAASGGAFIMRMLAGNYLLLPELARVIVPSILRTAAPHAAPMTQHFFYSLADQSYSALDATGTWFQEASKGVGGYGQEALSWLVAGRYVTQKRVDAFLQLSEPEQQHLVEVAIKSDKLKADELQTLKKSGHLLGKQPKPTDEEVAKITLKCYDRLGTLEKLSISPTYFKNLEPAKQEKIIDLVDAKIGLNTVERENEEVIVAKFNKLSEDDRKSIDQLSIWEFSQMSEDQQHSILFAIAHSEEYRESKEAGNTASFGVDQYRKMRSGLANKDLAKLLVLYGNLEAGEKAILTPAHLGSQSPAKILHAMGIVKKYRADLIPAFMQKGLNLSDLERVLARPNRGTEKDLPLHKHHEERLIEALASCFSDLRPQQKKEFLLFTQAECNELETEEKKAIISYLMAIPSQQANIEAFKSMLVLLDEKKPIDTRLLVRSFNSLSTMEQAAFRDQQSRAIQSKETLFKTCENEIEKIARGLIVLNSKLSTQESRYAGMQLRLENARKGGTKKEVAACEQSLHDRAKLIDTLENERSRLVAQYAALKEFLPEAKQARFAGIDASPIPPEWLTSMREAIDLTIKTLNESRLTASIAQLREFKGLRTDYDKLLKQQQNQIEREREEHIKAKAGFVQEVARLTDALTKDITPEDKVATRMKISFIKQFYYKLHDKAVQELAKLADEHQKQEEPLRDKKYPKD